MPLELRGRHATSGPPAPGGFTCPACGAENTRPIEQGCASCGSGTAAARHVGETTPAGRKPTPVAAERYEPREYSVRVVDEKILPVHTQTTDVRAAFTEWARVRGWTDDTATLIYEAFSAGWAAGQGGRPAVPLVVGGEVLAGTPESRTLVAALRLFLDQVVPVAQEEIAAGEYLGATEIERLIRQLEQTSGEE